MNTRTLKSYQIPTGIYLFKANTSVVIVNFEQISHIALVYLLLL